MKPSHCKPFFIVYTLETNGAINCVTCDSLRSYDLKLRVWILVNKFLMVMWVWVRGVQGLGWPVAWPILGRAWALKSGLINKWAGVGFSGRKSEAWPSLNKFTLGSSMDLPKKKKKNKAKKI